MPLPKSGLYKGTFELTVTLAKEWRIQRNISYCQSLDPHSGHLHYYDKTCLNKLATLSNQYQYVQADTDFLPTPRGRNGPYSGAEGRPNASPGAISAATAATRRALGELEEKSVARIAA